MFIYELIPGLNIEDSRNEFKGIIEEGVSDSGKNKEIGWLKTIAAFANTEGGHLFIGVENKTHKVVALDHNTADKTVLMIHRQIKQRLEPAVAYKIKAVPCGGRFVIEVVVEPSKVLPVMLHEEGLLGIYVRNFGNSVLATSEQIRDLILMSDSNPFDQTFTDVVFRHEDFNDLFKVYKEKTDSELTEKALISIGFMDRRRLLSRGALLFKDGSSDERTKITATLWPGTTKGSSLILASEEFTGNILESIVFATKFIQNHSVNGYRKEDTGRVDYFSYPIRSITEGVVNAVAHRNYFISGSQIEINMFKDRLEITSPGALLGVREIEKETRISSIIPRRRNEVICSVLEFCRYMESKGSGFDKIEHDYAGKGDEYKPYISSSASSFTLVLPNLTFSGIVDENTIPEVYTDAILEGKNDLKILAFCFNESRSVTEIAEYAGVHPSTYFRKNVLNNLVKKGYLIEDLSSKKSRYLTNTKKVFAK